MGYYKNKQVEEQERGRRKKQVAPLTATELREIVRKISPLLIAITRAGGQASLGTSSNGRRVMVGAFFKGAPYREYFDPKDVEIQLILDELNLPDELDEAVCDELNEMMNQPPPEEELA